MTTRASPTCSCCPAPRISCPCWRRTPAAAGRDSRQTRDGYVVWPYRPRIEGLFSRIERWTRISDGDTYWRSISATMSRPSTARRPESRIADPAATRKRLHLAHQREPRRQRQCDLLRICRGRLRQHRSAAGPRAQSHGSRPRRQPLSQARQIRQLCCRRRRSPTSRNNRGCSRPCSTTARPRDAASRRCRRAAIRNSFPRRPRSPGRHGRIRSRAIAPASRSAPIGCAAGC